MAKKNFDKGIAKLLTPTVEDNEGGEVEKVNFVNVAAALKDEPKAPPAVPEPVKTKESKKPAEQLVGYNIKYPKSLQKRIKRFCIEHDGIFMNDVFMQGAIMFMESYKRS
jgi:hypothetical protein